MIKINVISNHKAWNNYIKNPSNFFQKKLIILIKDFINIKKKIFFVQFYYLVIKKLNDKTKNLGKKIVQQMFYHFLFIVKMNLKKKLITKKKFT